MPPIKKMKPAAAAKPPPPPEVDEDDPDDGEDEEAEQFGVPDSLLAAAGIASDEDWDSLPSIDLDALKARNRKR